MKVPLGAIDVSYAERRALRARVGQPGLATADEVREFYLTAADAVLLDVLREWEESKPQEAAIFEERNRSERRGVEARLHIPERT